jgi:hypothetical protein
MEGLACVKPVEIPTAIQVESATQLMRQLVVLMANGASFFACEQ